MPIRFCEKNMGPGSSITIAIMIIKNSHENRINPTRDIIISMHLLKNFLYTIARFLNVFVKSKLLYPYNNHTKNFTTKTI